MHDNVKRGFLQACLNHGCIEIAEVHEILRPMCEAYDESAPKNFEELKSFVSELNESIEDYNQALVFMRHTVVQKEFLVFTSTIESDVSKKQSHLNDNDRFYFTKLIETIVHQPEYCISVDEARSLLNDLNMTSSQRTALHKNHLVDMINLWTQQGYFLKHNHQLYFGPRMVMEFPTYFKQNYEDHVKSCTLCGKLVFWDVKCSHCCAKIHYDCIKHYLIKNSKCPACKKDWTTRLSRSNEE